MSMHDAAPSAAPHAPPAAGALRISLRTATILLVFTLAFTALMAGVYQLTRPVIEATALDAKRRLIAEVLPPDAYDNDLLADAVVLPPVPAIGLAEPTRLYRARKGGAPAALVLEAAALDGYSGQIGLILAVRADGRLAAVRVTGHKETPGLGDYIDPKKDKNKASPWIAQFAGRNFGDTPREKWRVKKDGGAFDQRTGATISARAVVKATGNALAWALERADAFYALPAEARYEEK
ncbi:MAG: electron transport complex subunit RsxG [Pseudomonadota bacterium]